MQVTKSAVKKNRDRVLVITPSPLPCRRVLELTKASADLCGEATFCPFLPILSSGQCYDANWRARSGFFLVLNFMLKRKSLAACYNFFFLV